MEVKGGPRIQEMADGIRIGMSTRRKNQMRDCGGV
jgi:hypothetical protein